MKSVLEYKKWSKAVADHFGITEERLLDTRHIKDTYISKARGIFFKICFVQGIDVYQLAIHLGRHRSTGMHHAKKNVPGSKEVMNDIIRKTNGIQQAVS